MSMAAIGAIPSIGAKPRIYIASSAPDPDRFSTILSDCARAPNPEGEEVAAVVFDLSCPPIDWTRYINQQYPCGCIFWDDLSAGSAPPDSRSLGKIIRDQIDVVLGKGALIVRTQEEVVHQIYFVKSLRPVERLERVAGLMSANHIIASQKLREGGGQWI